MAWDDAKEQEFRALRQQLFSSFTTPEPAEPAVKQNTSALSDFGTDLKRGIQQLPGAVTGLLDIPVAAATGRAMVSEGWDEIGKLTGFQPGKWADEARAEYSPARQAAMQEAQQAEGVVDTAKAYLSNPSMLAGTVIESLPGVALGGAYARALKGIGSLGGVVRGGIGEGAVMAGSSMENMVDEGADPRVAAGLSSVVGVAGGAMSVLGGRLAERIGVLDPDTLVAGGVQAARQPMSLGRRVVGGAISEGLFEEAPQTAVETIAGNVAVGREWDEDLGKNMTVGALAGGVMGGVFNIPGARRPVDVTDDAAAAPQQDLLGDPVAPAPADTDTPFDVAALRDEYATLMSQAKGLQSNPAQVAAITSRMQEIRDTFRANDAPVEALHIDLVTKRAKALDAEIGRTEKKYESQLLNTPESAAATADRLTELRQAREALAPYLTPDTGGQMDLFGDAPPAGAAAPVQATQAPVDDPFSELRQAAPSAFMQSGAMRQRAQEAFNAYNEFSDNEIDAAIDQLAKSKDAAAWRIPMLEFIKASRAQENADVQATEMDAPSGAAEGDVAQGSESVAPVRAGADGSVDRATGAPARSRVQSPSLGSTPVQQPTDLTGATNGTETPDAALQGQATAQAEGQVADAAQGQDPALDAPGQADAVQERRDGQGQEGLLTPVADEAPREISISVASGLPKVQGLVNDHITKAVQNGDIDEIVDAQGVLQYEKIAKALGKKRGSVKAAVDGLVQKIAAANGMTVEEAKAQLRKRQRTTEVSDYDNLGLSPAMQRSTVDDADLFGTNSDRGGSGEQTMEIVSSVGQTNANPFSDSMGAGNEEGTAFLEAAGVTDARGAVSVQETPDPIAERRAAEAAAKREAAIQYLLASPEAAEASQDWDDMRSEGAPTASQLPRDSAVEWTLEYERWKNQEITTDELDKIQRAIEREVADLAGVSGGSEAAVLGERGAVEAQPSEQGRLASPTAEAEQRAIEAEPTAAEPANPLEARVAALRARGLTDQQTKRLDRIVSRYASGDIDLGRVVDELDTFEQALAFSPTSTAPAQAAPAPVVAKKAKRTIDKTAAASDGLKFSKADTIIVDGVARPRTNSNGKPIHSTDEGIRNFWRWFGDSKVVDAQGRPLVVYHGTAGDFDSFRPSRMGTLGPGIYFAFSRAGAQAWASRYKGGRVIEAYVRAENPVRLNNTGEASALYDRFAPEGSDADMVLGLRREGYDAAWAVGAAKSAFGDLQPEIAVYDPTQIKSATSNVGSYDPNDSRIQRSSASAPDQNASVESVRSAIESIATPAGRRKVTVVQSADELVERGILSSTDAQGTQGFVDKQGNAFFIAENIPAGAELAVALHEIGAHIGIETILTDEQYRQLVTKIFEWARSDGNTQEAQIARAAIERIDAANLTNEADLAPEVIAYFVEEAVKAGVNPTALNYKSELGRWFRTLWAALKTALEKLGIVDVDKLTAQNVVDLAYGAAYLELSDPGTRSDPIDKGGRMLFSKNPTPTGMFDTLKNMVASTDVFVNTVGHARAARNKSLTLEQLAEVAESPEVDAYRRAMVAMQTDSKERVNAAAKIDFEWAKLYDKDSWFGFGKKADNSQANKLSEVMRAATRAQFDPDKNEAPTTEEQRDIAAMWDGLSEDARKVYRQVREFYEDSFKERKAILMKAAEAAKKSGANTREVERMFAKMKGPYFPLMRLGGYYSVGMSSELAGLVAKQAEGTATAAELKRIELLRKDKNHYVTSGHQTRAEAKRASDEFRKEMGYGHFNEVEKKIASEVSSIPDMAKIEAHIAADLPADMRQHVKDMLAQMYFDLLPARHALKQSMMREGVHGEETNMRRVFATSAVAQAHHISRLKHTSTLSEKLLAVKVAGRTDDKLRNVYNTLVQHSALALEQDQENRFVNGIMQVSYLANLGLSPAFLITNLTQVPMVTLPWLSARFGTGAATRALWTSFADVAKMMGATYGKGDFLKGGWRSEFNWSSMFPAGSGVDKMYTEMLNRNLLDITMEHDLGVVAEMRSSTLDNTLKVINTPVRLTELANRALTALTAYRLSLARDNNHERAVEMAAQALSKTQLDYSYLNAPYFMKSMFGSKSAARIMMQFRKFQQGMLYLVLKSTVDSFGAAGKTEDETKRLRSEARKTLGGLFLTTGVMAGAVGMPMMGTVLMALTLAGGDDDEPFDAEVALRNYVADRLGKEYADALVKGLPQLLGVDMGRVGMGGLLNPVPIVQRADGDKQQAMNYFSAFVGGAPASTAFNIYEGLIMMANGDVAKGAEKVVPLKAAQNLIRAARYESEGMTDRNSNTVLPADRFDAADLVLRGMGFQTTLEENYYAATSAVQNAKDHLTKRRAKLLNAYVQARLAGEPVDEVEIQIARFNEKNPERGLRIDHATKLRSLEARRRLLAERNESGLSTSKANEPYLDRARFATS